MANRVLTIVAKVKDAASSGLDRISDSLKRTGKSAQQTGADFTQFNKIMFSTTAYVGFFQKSFANFGDTILKGAEFDRVATQFEQVMGPKGDLFKAIAGFTDNSIDKVEALRAGIQLKTLGIANSTGDIAELIARSGTAAKMAGIDSGEGIKKFTQFLKDGSIANLEFLNLIRSSDPALKLQMSLIEKMGGVMGGALSAQMKYNMGLRLLRTATNGAMKGQRDLYDVLFDLKQSFTMLKNEVGIFLGNALKPVFEKITALADKFSAMLEYVRTSKKEILFLAKALLSLAGSFAGLLATTGTIRLVALGLKALGISTFPIISGIMALITVFSGLTSKIKEGTTPLERFLEKVRVFSAVLKGITQLVASYLSSQDNMSKGIAQIDQDLFELLNKNGLFLFVHNMAKVIATVGKFGIEVFKELYSWAVKLDEMFGGFTNNIFKLFGVNKKINVDVESSKTLDEPYIKRLSSIWLDTNSKVYQMLVKAGSFLLSAFTAVKFLGIGKSALSKLPFIGKMFGSSAGNKPDGTKSNPIFTALASENTGPLSILPEGLKGALLGMFMEVELFFKGLTALKGTAAIYLLLSAFGFLSGVVDGLVENFDSFSNVIGGLSDYMTAKLTEAFDLVWPTMKALFIDPVADAFNTFVSWLGFSAEALKSFYNWISNLPGVGSIVKAAVNTAINPLGTFSDFGKNLIGTAAAGADMLNSAARNSTAQTLMSSAQNTGTLPFMPNSSADRYDYATRAIDQSTGADRDRMVRALKEALADTSAGGKEITADEFKSIFGLALDNSKITKHTEKTAKEVEASKKTNLTSRRGGC